MLKPERMTNAEKFKMRMYKDYQHGPVKTYTPEEIEEWERTSGVAIRRKIEEQQRLTPEEIRELDKEHLKRVEHEFKEMIDNMEHDYGRES